MSEQSEPGEASRSGPTTSRPDGWYEIRVQGHLPPRWSVWFDDMTLRSEPDGTTTIRGPVIDQAALHGLLHKLRDVGIPILALTAVPPVQSTEPTTLTINEEH